MWIGWIPFWAITCIATVNTSIYGKFVKLLTLSHGQSDVERVFGINEEVLVENMKKKSLVSQRIVYDHCSAVKMELHNFNVTKELLISCRCKYKI